MTTCNPNFLQEQICTLEKTIRQYQAAEIALASGTIQSYSFDSGQTSQTVTKLNMSKLRDTIMSLWNQYIVLCNRVNGNGGGALIARPCF